MVFNITFNNISVISWWSVLLVEETGVPEETTDLSQVTDKLYHLVVIGTDCTYNHDHNHDHDGPSTIYFIHTSKRSRKKPMQAKKYYIKSVGFSCCLNKFYL